MKLFLVQRQADLRPTSITNYILHVHITFLPYLRGRIQTSFSTTFAERKPFWCILKKVSSWLSVIQYKSSFGKWLPLWDGFPPTAWRWWSNMGWRRCRGFQIIFSRDFCLLAVDSAMLGSFLKKEKPPSRGRHISYRIWKCLCVTTTWKVSHRRHRLHGCPDGPQVELITSPLPALIQVIATPAAWIIWPLGGA